MVIKIVLMTTVIFSAVTVETSWDSLYTVQVYCGYMWTLSTSQGTITRPGGDYFNSESQKTFYYYIILSSTHRTSFQKSLATFFTMLAVVLVPLQCLCTSSPVCIWVVNVVIYYVSTSMVHTGCYRSSTTIVLRYQIMLTNTEVSSIPCCYLFTIIPLLPSS